MNCPAKKTTLTLAAEHKWRKTAVSKTEKLS
jgi:hypothetical protein